MWDDEKTAKSDMFQFLIGTIQTVWPNPNCRSSGIHVSIPHRYDPNNIIHEYSRKQAMFQFLIGTIRTGRCTRIGCGVFEMFQFLIGTIRTRCPSRIHPGDGDAFQFLIGTIRTFEDLISEGTIGLSFNSS